MKELLTQPSTWRGLALLLGAILGWTQDQADAFMSVGVAIAGGISVFWETA